MPKNLSFAMVVVLMSLIPVYAGAQAVFDASKVTDAKAKAAVEKINELQAKIKELKIDEMTSVIQVKIRDAATSIVMKTTVMERRPDLFYKSEKTVGGPMNGNKNGILLDGKNMWRIDVAGDAHVKMMIENMQKQKMPQDQIDKMVAGMRMRVTRCDLQRIRDAGAWDKFELMNKGTLNPLSVISPASLKIDHYTTS
ncbi:hypothetical protein LLG95_01430 [bacterium]|nr:hypothetical protein [bacterium]